MLVWKPHLGTLANSLVILGVMVWMYVMWRRYRKRYTIKNTLLLLAPKLVVTLLVVLALMDPAWRDSSPSEDSQKVAVISDISTSMDVVDKASASRAERAKKIADEIIDELDGMASVENYRFDVDVLAPDDTPATGTRNTDLGRTIVTLSKRPDLTKNMFDQLDKNKDGFLTKDEFKSPALFPLFDSNQDERVTRSEDTAGKAKLKKREAELRKAGKASKGITPPVIVGPDCKAIVLLTDGGDDTELRVERLPDVPIYIVGIGTDPKSWNDLEIGNAEIPEEVELGTPFKVSADIVVHSASSGFATKAKSVDVKVEKKVDGVYQLLKTVNVVPRSNNGRVKFDLPAEETPGVYQYRLSVKGIKGEMTELNNAREFSVDVREKSINVLLYGNMLDWNFALLKRKFGDDPTIKLTTVYRKSAETVIIDGKRQEGDAVLTRGFPKDEEILGLYTIIVLGSFPSELISTDSFTALKNYVEGGGNLVMLGGPNSFDKGGYYNTAIAPLLPWKKSTKGQGISAGIFPVMVPPEGESHGLSGETATILKGVGSPVFHSVNRVGERRSGAMSLMNASVGSRVVPVVVLQPFGKGQILGVATDTLWRWGRMDGDIASAGDQFWRDTIRYLSGEIEGGRFLTVKWDRKRYRPSEEALVDIGVVGRYAEDAVHLKGSREHDGTIEDLDIKLQQESDFQTRVFFPKPGEYKISMEATLAGNPLDTYERTIRIGSSVSEGAALKVDDRFLEELATRSGGSYSPEGETEELLERLDELLLASSELHDTPLVKIAALFNLFPLYIILLMGALLWEWILRRRMNIV